MKGFLITTAMAATAMALGACGPSDPRDYREPADSPMAAPNATPTQSVPPDSTTGVARASGRPGVAGDTISRSSRISAPPGKSPDPQRP